MEVVGAGGGGVAWKLAGLLGMQSAGYLALQQATATEPQSLVDNVVGAVLASLVTGGGIAAAGRWLVSWLKERDRRLADDLRRKEERLAHEVAQDRADQQSRPDDLKAQVATLRGDFDQREQRIRGHDEREVQRADELLAAEQERNERFVTVLWAKHPAETAEARREFVRGEHQDGIRPTSGPGPGVSPG